MEFLDFIFAVIFILWIVRMIIRIVMPMLMQKVMNKAQQFQQNSQQNYTQNNKRAEGVKVDYIPQTPKSKIPDSEGDFIDYEEIK
jgi:hypothetical protein